MLPLSGTRGWSIGNFRLLILLWLGLGQMLYGAYASSWHLRKTPVPSLSTKHARLPLNAASFINKLELTSETIEDVVSVLRSSGIFYHALPAITQNVTFWAQYPWTKGYVFAIIGCKLIDCVNHCGTLDGFMPQGKSLLLHYFVVLVYS